ncbi:MAG TPA: xanthine dehydrogenase family protein molybdopterin-binding subunit [Candidatus Eisenbacteria bacterium]|nr:xanthine dehydrogenase family protein molybdopterin-binding subunit [Candidatus Eisenbacteria bacterium]
MAQTYIGTPIKRREDVRFVTGRGTYADDVKLPGMLHAAILRSPYAHARIRSIDTAAAAASPGVAWVFTLRDIGEAAMPVPMRMYKIAGLERYLQPLLAQNKVRYVGEPVAVAVAESRYLAEDALDAIEVEYEELPAVIDVAAALRDDVLVHEEAGTNLAAVHEIHIGDAATAFAGADYTRREVFRVHRHTGNPMETRGLVAHFDAGKRELTVYGMTKLLHYNRQVIAGFLRLPEHKLHFIENDVGGGFGIRGELYPEDFLIPFASFRLGAPVKWIEDRREHLMAANHSREITCELEIAARRDGTLLALRAKIYGNMGAYVRTHGGLVPCSTAALLTGPYRIRNYECRIHCVVTNKTGMGTYRAPGRYESCFFRERMLDMVAADLTIDPVELRRRNLIQPEEIPYEIGVTRPGGSPTVLDSANFPSALNRALKEFDYEGLKSRQGRLENGRYHGIGLAYFVKNTGGLEPYEGARIVIGEGPSVAVYISINVLGQGHETAMAQICADALGVPLEWISVFHGNTDLVPFGWGTFASRGTVMCGNAVHLAALKLKEKLLRLAGEQLNCDPAQLELQGGAVYRKGSAAALLDMEELVVRAREAVRQSVGRPELEETAYFNCSQLTHSYGVHLAHVAVEVETGTVEILRYMVVEDVGRCINPLLVHGQAVGAAAQGIGGTLLEELVYDENGQLLTTTFRDYVLPASTDVPRIESVVLEEAPSPLNPLGVKGAGEGGIVGTGAVLANALSHALSGMGLQVTALPLSPENVRKLIRNRAARAMF